MDQLTDYSMDFIPCINWDYFSREMLLEGLKFYREMFLAIDGFWYLSVKERFHDRGAIACDLWVWEKFFRFERKRLKRLFKITGEDVESMFKAFQMSSWGGNIKYDIILQNKDHGILRVNDCPTLAAIKKEGQGREKYFCREVEQPMFKMLARSFHPKIIVKALQIPPDSESAGIFCAWEFEKQA